MNEDPKKPWWKQWWARLTAFTIFVGALLQAIAAFLDILEKSGVDTKAFVSQTGTGLGDLFASVIQFLQNGIARASDLLSINELWFSILSLLGSLALGYGVGFIESKLRHSLPDRPNIQRSVRVIGLLFALLVGALLSFLSPALELVHQIRMIN